MTMYDASGLNGLGMALLFAVVILGVVVIPYCLGRQVEQEDAERERQARKRRREHFAQTARFRQECDPVFNRLTQLGNELERM